MSKKLFRVTTIKNETLVILPAKNVELATELAQAKFGFVYGITENAFMSSVGPLILLEKKRAERKERK